MPEASRATKPHASPGGARKRSATDPAPNNLSLLYRRRRRPLSYESTGRWNRASVSHLRPLRCLWPPLRIVSSWLTYGSVPEDGDFSWFRLRHISFCFIASSPRGVPQPPTGMASKDSGSAQIRHTACRWQQESPVLCGADEEIYVHGFKKNTHTQCYFKSCEKAWSLYGSTVTASLPFAM